MQDFFQHINWNNIISSAATIVIAIVLYNIIKIPFKRAFKRDKNRERNTILAMFASFIRIIYISLVILFVLQINGVDVSGVLAGVGVASVAIGLAIQDTLKDIIRGVSLVSEDYFKMGDYVTIGEYSGTVIYSGIRSTKLRDGLTGDIISIANRNIEKVKVAKAEININLPLPYNLALSKAEAIMDEISAACKNIETLQECEYRGVQEFAESAIEYRLYAKCEQGKRITTKRVINHKILEVLEKHKISIPFKQVDIHTTKS
jgi:small conductance mechanosensitive channel